jgi:hypothetical protein
MKTEKVETGLKNIPSAECSTKSAADFFSLYILVPLLPEDFSDRLSEKLPQV